jgi:hypothetical protein
MKFSVSAGEDRLAACLALPHCTESLFIRREQGHHRPTKDSVAFARKRFKPFRIEKGDPATGIMDQSLRL